MKIYEIVSKLKPFLKNKDVKTSIAIASILIPLLIFAYIIALFVVGYVCVQSVNLIFSVDISASLWSYVMLGIFLDIVLSAIKKK